MTSARRAAPLQVVLADGETVYEPFDTVGGRYLVFSASSLSGTFPQLLRAEIIEVHRPRYGARFACSDPKLQRIVDVSLRTVDLSAVDAYLDCPTREQRAWTEDSVVHQSVDPQPFFRALVHDAVAALGGDLLPLYREWTRLLDSGPTAMRECWEGGSYCHGWSATVARDVVVHTLGVTPAAPGYAAVRIAPHVEDLEWADTLIPTPHGDIEVRVEQDLLIVRTPVPSSVEWGGDRKALPPGLHRLERTLR